jgi:cell division protein FtsL
MSKTSTIERPAALPRGPRQGPQAAPKAEQRRRLGRRHSPGASRSSRRPNKRVRLVVAGGLFLLLGVAVNVAAQAKLAAGQIRLDSVEQENIAKERAYDRLRLEVAQLRSPERIVAAAQAQGLVRRTAEAEAAQRAAGVTLPAVDPAAVGGSPANLDQGDDLDAYAHTKSLDPGDAVKP